MIFIILLIILLVFVVGLKFIDCILSVMLINLIFIIGLKVRWICKFIDRE